MYTEFNKRLVIVGGSGLIGRNLTKACIDKKINFLSTYYSNKIFNNQIKFNINENRQELVNKLDEKDIVIIFSAYANPNWVFENKSKAYDFNVVKTIDFINEVKKRKSKIFFLSSVEVFDGKNGNYKENDKKNPLNFYGENKTEVENYIINNLDNYCIVRTGWNIGMSFESRCVIKLTYNTLLSDNAKMAHDNFFTITHVEDFCKNLIQIIDHQDDKVIHLSSDFKISRIQLADSIIKNSLLAKKMRYKKVAFSEIKFKEPRSRLNNLNTELIKSKFNLKFRDPFLVIKEKIKILDKNYS